MQVPLHPAVPVRLTAYLTQWLGTWPATTPLQVIATPGRLQPGWDGKAHPALAVADPATGAVLSVPPTVADDVRRWADRGGPCRRPPSPARPAGRSGPEHLPGGVPLDHRPHVFARGGPVDPRRRR